MVWPWFRISGAFMVGVVVAGLIRPHPLLVYGCFAAVGITLLVGAWHRKLPVALLLIGVCLAGCARLSFAATMGRGTVWAWEGQSVAVTGTLLETPHVQGRSWVALLAADGVDQVGVQAPVQGRVWLQWREAPGPDVRAGERLRLSGRLEAPAVAVHAGDFDQSAYLHSFGAFVWLRVQRTGTVLGRSAPMLALLDGVQQRLLTRFTTLWPGEQGALLLASLLGQREGLAPDVPADFKASGIYHLLVVSGLHVGAVAGLVLWLLVRCRVRRTHAALLALPVVLAYALVTPGGVAVWRATLMACAGLVVLAFGWRRSSWDVVGLTALALLLVEPFTLFTPAFQLSFLGVGGIMLWHQRLHTWLAPAGRRAAKRWQRLWWHVVGALAVGAAAQLALLPIILYWFGAVSLLGLPLGALGHIWLVLILAAGALGLCFGGLPGVMGAIMRWPAGALATGMLRLTHTAGHLPGGFWQTGKISAGAVVAFYGVLLMGDLWVRRREPWVLAARNWCQARVTAALQCPRRLLAVVLTAALLLGAVGCAVQPTTYPMRLWVINVGQGDALLLRTPGPSPQWWLVDGGPAPALNDPSVAASTRVDEGEAAVLPLLRRLGVKRLDVVVVTHAHQDHAGGLAAVARRMPIGEVWDTGFDHESSGYTQFMTEVAARDIPVRHPYQDDARTLTDGARMRVLWPVPGLAGDDPNQHSIVLQVAYGHSHWLLTGCIGRAVEEQLMQHYGSSLQSDFLKVGHHGSQTSTSAAWLQETRPTLAAISAGAGNTFGHPDLRVLQRLRAAQASILRTDTGGTLELASNGVETWLEQGYPGLPASLGSRPSQPVPLVGAW